MKAPDECPIVLCQDQPAWHNWLAEHHTEPTGIWLQIAKKAGGMQSVTYTEAVDEALCFGWIDGQKQSYDEQYFLQKFTPRRAKSIWSKVNVQKIAQLIEAGRMQPTGLAAVTAAQLDGRWERAYDSHSTSTVPPDFQTELDAHPNAKAFFATLNKTNIYSFLWRIQTAKKPETRQARIQKFIQMLEDGQTLH